MKDVIADNSRMHSRTGFKLGGNYRRGVGAGILSKSVCQTNRKYNGGYSAFKMQKSMEKRLQIAEILSAVIYEVIAI